MNLEFAIHKIKLIADISEVELKKLYDIGYSGCLTDFQGIGKRAIELLGARYNDCCSVEQYWIYHLCVHIYYNKSVSTLLVSEPHFRVFLAKLKPRSPSQTCRS